LLVASAFLSPVVLGLLSFVVLGLDPTARKKLDGRIESTAVRCASPARRDVDRRDDPHSFVVLGLDPRTRKKLDGRIGSNTVR
jgi:hypothetical protein